MSMEYIRDTYKVPAKRGGKIEFNGEPGVIVGSQGQYLKIKLDGGKKALRYHPTWQIKYIDPSPESEASGEEYNARTLGFTEGGEP